MGSLPLVTVVIPVFNGAEYIEEAIDSVLGQDYPNVELIVLDDGSTDSTAHILRGYEGKFFWETHENMGQANTLNKGFHMARGELLTYLSADDTLLPNAVTTSVECLMEHEDIVLTYCDYYLINSNSDVTRRVYTPNFNYHDMVTKIICSPGPGAIFRRRALEITGSWDSRLRQVPDYDFWLRLGLCGRFLRIPEPLAKFRVHDKSQSYEEPDEKRSEEIIHVMNRYFELHGVPESIMASKRRTMSNANIIAARFHLRAGRYGLMFAHLSTGVRFNILCLFSCQTIKLMGNGLAYRIKKLSPKY
jgi:glycosyltransferase involved in cell wall biosynthesis